MITVAGIVRRRRVVAGVPVMLLLLLLRGSGRVRGAGMHDAVLADGEGQPER